MTYVQKVVNDETVFPTKHGNEFPANFEVVLKKVQINSSGYYKCEVRPGTWALVNRVANSKHHLNFYLKLVKSLFVY